MRHMIRNAGVTLLVFWSLCWCSSAADDDGDDLVGLVQRNNGARTARTLGTYDTTLAFTIPLFSFTLPERQDLVENKDYTKQAALSLLGLGLVGGLAVIPYIFAAVGRAGADRLTPNIRYLNSDSIFLLTRIIALLLEMIDFDSFVENSWHFSSENLLTV